MSRLRLSLSKRRINIMKMKNKSLRLFNKTTGSGIAPEPMFTMIEVWSRKLRIQWSRLPMWCAKLLKYQQPSKINPSVIPDLQVKTYSNATTHTKTNHN